MEVFQGGLVGQHFVEGECFLVLLKERVIVNSVVDQLYQNFFIEIFLRLHSAFLEINFELLYNGWVQHLHLYSIPRCPFRGQTRVHFRIIIRMNIS